jgi:hypothetical protein
MGRLAPWIVTSKHSRWTGSADPDDDQATRSSPPGETSVFGGAGDELPKTAPASRYQQGDGVVDVRRRPVNGVAARRGQVTDRDRRSTAPRHASPETARSAELDLAQGRDRLSEIPTVMEIHGPRATTGCTARPALGDAARRPATPGSRPQEVQDVAEKPPPAGGSDRPEREAAPSDAPQEDEHRPRSGRPRLMACPAGSSRSARHPSARGCGRGS